MDKRRLLIRLVALICPAVLIWFFVTELTGDETMHALSGFIAIGVTALTALLVWNRSMRVQLLTSALLCAVVTLLFRVMISEDPSRKIQKELIGTWKSLPHDGQSSVTLNFISDQEVDVGISDTQRCQYTITPQQELVITDNISTTTYEIRHLQNDTLDLKMEFETLSFVRGN